MTIPPLRLALFLLLSALLVWAAFDQVNDQLGTAEREREQLTATVADLRMRLDRAEQRITALIGNQKQEKRRFWWPW